MEEPETEVWRYIKGTRKGYQVSSIGRVRSRRDLNGHTLKMGGWRVCQTKVNGKKGHARVRVIYFDKGEPVKRMRLVSHLVLESFRGPRKPGYMACHFPNSCRTDNHLGNLRWDTPENNQRDSMIMGTGRSQKLTVETAVAIKALLSEGKSTSEIIEAHPEANCAIVSHIRTGQSWTWTDSRKADIELARQFKLSQASV